MSKEELTPSEVASIKDRTSEDISKSIRFLRGERNHDFMRGKFRWAYNENQSLGYAKKARSLLRKVEQGRIPNTTKTQDAVDTNLLYSVVHCRFRTGSI